MARSVARNASGKNWRHPSARVEEPRGSPGHDGTFGRVQGLQLRESRLGTGRLAISILAKHERAAQEYSRTTCTLLYVRDATCRIRRDIVCQQLSRARSVAGIDTQLALGDTPCYRLRLHAQPTPLREDPPGRPDPRTTTREPHRPARRDRPGIRGAAARQIG